MREPTKDEVEDLALLKLANSKGLFALPLGDFTMQPALERGVDHQWFTLVDMTVIAAPESKGSVMRIFRLTSHGRQRLRALKNRAS